MTSKDFSLPTTSAMASGEKVKVKPCSSLSGENDELDSVAVPLHDEIFVSPSWACDQNCNCKFCKWIPVGPSRISNAHFVKDMVQFEMKDRYREITETVIDDNQPEDVGQVERQMADLLLDVKHSRRQKFERGSKRFNKRETKKRNYKKFKPHAAEPPGQDDGSDPLLERWPVNSIEPPGSYDATSEFSPRDERTVLTDLASDTESILVPKEDGFFDFLKTLQVPEEFATKDVDFWMSHLENLALLAYHMARATSLTDVTMAVFSYIKMNTKRSCTFELAKLIDELVGSVPTDVDQYEPHAWKGREVLDAWDLFKTNTIFTKISYLITAAMSLTVCSMKEIEWSPFGLKLISLKAAEKQLEAVDLLDALLNTFVWCCETGWRVYEQKSLKPLLYSDQSMQDYNKQVDWLLAYSAQAIAGELVDLGLYERKLEDALKRTAELKSVQKTGSVGIWLQARYSELIDIKFRIQCKHKNSKLSFAAYALAVTGPTGVGKSTFMKIGMRTALTAMGFEYDPARCVTEAKGDDFDSTLFADCLGIYYDDFGHGKPQYEETSPVDHAIRMIGNIAAQAVKAELALKGVVFIDIKCYVASSNHQDLNVHHYTDVPEAVLRRFIFARLSVKGEYRKPGTILLDKYHPELQKEGFVKDVWEVSFEECEPFVNKKGRTSYRFVPLKLSGIPTQKVGMSGAIDVIVHTSRKHAAVQRNLIEHSNEYESEDLCLGCVKPVYLCKCASFQTPVKTDVPALKEVPLEKDVDPHALEHIGDLVVGAAKKSLWRYFTSWYAPISWWNSLLGFSPIKKMATQRISDELTAMIDDAATPMLISMVPDWLFSSNIFQRLCGHWRQTAAMRNMMTHYRFCTYSGIGLCTTKFVAYRTLRVFPHFWCNSAIVALFSLGVFFGASYRFRVAALESEYIRRRDALPEHWKAVRDNKIVQGTVAIATLLVGVKLLRMWNLQRLQPQAGEGFKDTPVSSSEEKKEEPGWFGHMMEKLGVSVVRNTGNVSGHQVITTLQKSNLYWAEFVRNGAKTHCNVFFPQKGVVLFPRHVFYVDGDMSITPAKQVDVMVYRHNKPGGTFKFKVDFELCVKPSGRDLVCAFVPNCPDLRDKTYLFPTVRPTGNVMVDFFGKREGRDFSDRFVATMDIIGHKYEKQMHGCRYRSENAVDGVCMSVLIDLQNLPIIVGFHIGGYQQHGVAQTILKSEYELMLDELGKIDGVLISSSQADIPDKIMNREVISADKIHPHCLAARLPREAFVEVLGSTKLRTQQSSQVQTSILSEHITEVFGVPNKWGPPKLKPNWKGFNATLEHIVSPSDMFSPSLLKRAHNDWLEPLLPLAEQQKAVPLTLKESIMGIPGRRFIDALKMSTSMGFPVFGSKCKYFREIRDGEQLIDRVPDEMIVEEIDRLISSWKDGKRAYPVTSATLKDEPTELKSEKVRVFQASSVALTIVMRKYWLPVIEFLGNNPLISESAVGVNAFGREWETLVSKATLFAEDGKVLGFDYSKFDVRMNSQITTAVYSAFLEIAKRFDYSQEDLYIMQMMVSDIVHPLMDYNGTMIMAYNMNTSGNSLTVNVNCTANSFYLRMGFFSIYPEDNFRACVSPIFYGDDAEASVRSDKRKFNFISFREFLASHKIKITLPDKGDDIVEFLDIDECDFLKRRSNYIPEIKCSIGMLDEMSIFKSLHANLRSKTATKEQVACSCIEAAMHEWFAHGRQVYDTRRMQMLEVCKRVNLPVPAVQTTFDERVEFWISKYSST